MPTKLKPGDEIVPGHVLVRRLGSGGSGEVWVARAAGGVMVAIKVLRDLGMLASDRELEALRIVREAKHPNLCPLFGVWFFDEHHNLLSSEEAESILGTKSDITETVSFGDVEDAKTSSGFEPPLSQTIALSDSTTKPTQMIVAMGLGEQTLMDRMSQVQAEREHSASESGMSGESVVASESTHDYVAQPKLGIDPEELIRYMASAASAIDELNQVHNIYHCDIKPQNILLVGGQAQVCDFGLARKVEDTRKTSVAFGTPAYGAPEMLFERTYSKTIDQYSLAVTYYELRTGKLPYSSITQSALLRAKAIGEVDLSRVPPAERQVLARATDLDPELRFPDCRSMVEALADAIKHPELVPSDDVVGSKRTWMSLVAIGVLLLFVIGGSWYAFRPPPSERLAAATIANIDQADRRVDSATIPTAAEANADNATNPKPAITIPRDASENQDDPLLALLNADDAIGDRLAGVVELIESRDFRPQLVSRPSFLAMVDQVDSVTPIAADSRDRSTLEAVVGICKFLMSWADDKTNSKPQLLVRVAINNLRAATALASIDGTAVAGEDIDRVRNVFARRRRLNNPAAAADAALAVASSWMPRFTSQGTTSTLTKDESELAERDIIRAGQLNRDNVTAQQLLDDLSSSFLINLWLARRSASDLEHLNQLMVRVAGDLQQHPVWGSLALAAISLADPQASDYRPGILADEDAATLGLLPTEAGATYYLAAGWNRWNNDQNKAAVDDWGRAAAIENLAEQSAPEDRYRVAEHLVRWLHEISRVADRDVSQVRYAKKATSVEPVLRTAQKLAVGNAELTKRVLIEQFLCSVAAGKKDQAILRWETLDSLAAGPTDATTINLNPQTARALFDLSMDQLTAEPQSRSQSWLNRLVLAVNAQSDASWFGDAEQRPRGVSEVRGEIYGRCFKPAMDVLRDPISDPERVSQHGFDLQGLATFCDRFVSLVTETDRRSDYGDVVAYVQDIESSALIAGPATRNRQRRSELYFHAADALIRNLQELKTDPPLEQWIGKLQKYATEAKKYGTTVFTDCIEARLAEEVAYRATEEEIFDEQNDRAIAKYSNVIHSPSSSATSLFGLAYAGQARTLERKAILSDPDKKELLLDQALEAARQAVKLTPEDHQDRESRLETLARVCCEVSQLSLTKERSDKIRLVVEAIHAINEAIVIRQNKELDDLQLKVAKLFVLAVYVLVSKESPSSSATVREAIAWVDQIRDLVAQSGSPRLKCHWNYNAALILNETGEYAKAIEHATAAKELAKREIEPSERIRHLALIAYVVIRSNLELGPKKSKSDNLAIVAELQRDLKSIEQPTPPIARRQQSYLLELKRIEASMQ